MELLIRCVTEHEDGQPCDFVVTSPPLKCPKCGNANPKTLNPLVRIHLLVKDASGPIAGAKGNYYVPCDHKKKAIVEHVEAWSDQYLAVNCPQCKKSKEYEKLRDEHEMAMWLKSGGFNVPTVFTKPTENAAAGSPVPELNSPAVPPAEVAATTPAPAPSLAESLPAQGI